VTDPTGAVVPNAHITITSTDNGATRTAVTDATGRWLLGGLGSGNYKAKAEVQGFRTSAFNLNYDSNQPSMYNFPVSVASTAETVEVNGAMPQVATMSGTNEFRGQAGASVGGPITEREVASFGMNGRNLSQLVALAPGTANQNTASANVMNLQRRVAGVLPVAIDVPRAGTSFSFVRPLVLDEETKVTFSYKSR
jgi:hypothetical protein